MTILTKEVKGNLQAWGVGASINACIRMTQKTKTERKRPPRKNTIARKLWDSNGACIISYDENHFFICGLEWDKWNKNWHLFPMRHIGKRN